MSADCTRHTPCASAAPTVSSNTSQPLEVRDSTKNWCHSSVDRHRGGERDRNDRPAHPPAARLPAHGAETERAEDEVLREMRRLADQEVDEVELARRQGMADDAQDDLAEPLAAVLRGEEVARGRQHDRRPPRGRNPVEGDPAYNRSSSPREITVPEATNTRIRFTVYQPGMAPQQVTLRGEGLITLGRASDCTMPIKDRFLSRRHAEIVARPRPLVRARLRQRQRHDAQRREARRAVAAAQPATASASATAKSSSTPTTPTRSSSPSTATRTPRISPSPIDEDSRGGERTAILVSLALEFMADRPMDELFDFILDRVVHLLRPVARGHRAARQRRQTRSPTSACAGRTSTTRPTSDQQDAAARSDRRAQSRLVLRHRRRTRSWRAP